MHRNMTRKKFDYREDTGDVYHLPPPEPLAFDEYGLPMTYRIPPPLHRNEMDDSFDINYDDEDAPSPAILFQTHLDRWNLVRHRWKDATACNESRYEASFSMLRQIYERNRPEDPTVTAAASSNGNSEL